ncbi:23S rRNA (adenine(2030)-N(6))-methyltransferase RlmJ [Pseudohongiella spirulinae]|uniref:Ribosomal RNA large subunit methyltransferase J n=1 Tax=Pseudohongiella spirulinae TaxID=1249552 RepID=A0A0S2KAX6_9GAMM|nr:23S rRNA (adenine(2030)-N(6))-methyltransferase RlmJ [Pseudohongiella spirulinae]ALO45353.1 Ribosomal RNA large subunit methyltransferase J [Pseudohongiella spirulinae]
MLSYRHGFHAGNHADVLKHVVLLGLLQHLRKKDKPFVCIDTHSGPGFYRLDSGQARQTAEADGGIMPLWQRWRDQQTLAPLLQDYMAMVASFNPEDAGARPVCYPGSPAIMQSQLRESDRMHLMELHSTEIAVLKDNFRRDSRVHVHHRDGFEGAVGIVPPEPRRGLMLIDPAYEDKADYRRAADTVLAVHRRWQVGMIALWYPLLGKARDQGEWLSHKLIHALPCLNVQLEISPQTEEFGMHGSGMLIVNPPWQFDTLLQPVLTQLHAMLSETTQSEND